MAYAFSETILLCDVCGKLKEAEVKDQASEMPPFVTSRMVIPTGPGMVPRNSWCANCGDDFQAGTVAHA